MAALRRHGNGAAPLTWAALRALAGRPKGVRGPGRNPACDANVSGVTLLSERCHFYPQTAFIYDGHDRKQNCTDNVVSMLHAGL